MDISRLGQLGVPVCTRMDTSADVIERARRGDDEAFRLIFEQHHRFVLRFIYGMVGDLALAEELTQETFMRAHRGLANYREEGKLETWLGGIAKNVVRHASRRRRQEGQTVELNERTVGEVNPPHPAPDAQLLTKELRGVLHDALARLDEDKRLVFTLKVLQQRSYDEIAKITGYSVPKLKVDLHRAKAEMRRLIRPRLEMRDEM